MWIRKSELERIKRRLDDLELRTLEVECKTTMYFDDQDEFYVLNRRAGSASVATVLYSILDHFGVSAKLKRVQPERVEITKRED